MDVDDNYNFIFIHIPKTGGCSLMKSLGFPARRRHETIVGAVYERHKKPKKKLEEYFKFTIVRNPWERLVSTYFFCTQKEPSKPPVVNRNSSNFETWIREIYKQYGKKLPNDNRFESDSFWLTPQCDWILDKNENLLVDYIAKLENINKDIEFISERINSTSKNKEIKINTSDHEYYTNYYNYETFKIASAWYEKDIDYFGYRFDWDSGRKLFL